LAAGTSTTLIREGVYAATEYVWRAIFRQQHDVFSSDHKKSFCLEKSNALQISYGNWIKYVNEGKH